MPPPPSSPKPDNRLINDYSESVKRWIIRYRDARGDFDGQVEGAVIVKCQIMPNGDVTALTVLKSSGSGAMDNYILDMFMRASPLPVPPKEYQSEPLDLTFRFDLHS